MVGFNTWVTKKVLIVVRTYPTPATRGVEVSCTAGITEEGEWIRLFPIPYRFLDPDKRFRKYQLIEVSVKRSSDPRPESYEIDSDSIEILDEPLTTSNYWQARKERVLPLQATSLCDLQRQRRENGYPTLGFFKPTDVTFRIESEENQKWTQEELERLSQYSLFQNAPSHTLEKIPYKFRYEFQCNSATCNGHSMICTDWELGESYRRWRNEYGISRWTAAFRKKYQYEMTEMNDLHFFVGTVRQYPDSWIIVGLFYPRKAPDMLPGFE